jgi:hypothetical protein
MTGSRIPLARIRLARSLPRLLAVPFVVVLAGAAAVAAGLLLGSGATVIALIALGGTVMLGAVLAAAVLLSVRLEVAESTVALVWLGGRRNYQLVPGPVTRVKLRGQSASKLRPRSGALGWGIGAAMLRDEEEIELVRLAATRTAILIPTERGRLAVAPNRDEELLDALARAAHARQRAEDEQSRAEVPEPEPEPEVEPSSLTGIERALLEERLARERSQAMLTAEAARAAAEAAAVEVETDDGQEQAEPAVVEPRRPRRSLRLARPRPGWVFVLLPSAGAGIAWWAGQTLGTLPEPGSDLARLSSLALVLAGPATSVGAVMALAWWPRLVGVVVAGGLVASAFIGRSLFG